MIGLTKRNLLVFFRDRTSMFFSMLAPFIVIGLYVLFLGNAYSDGFGGISSREFMDNWIMAGLLAVTTVSTSMGAFGTMVNDRSKNILKDFYSSPISRARLTGGYILSSFIISLIMTLITFILAEIYIVTNGGALLAFTAFIKVLGILVVSNFCNTAIIYFIVSLLTSESAYSTASTIIGTLIGFITGIYLPIGNLPAGVQWIVKLFPPSHAAALLRQVMMEKPMVSAFDGAPAEKLQETKEMLGVVFKFGSYEVTPVVSIAILLACGALFFLLSMYSISRKKR
ncbi:MAG: ABC transporter permease [Eubacteriales bacterium]|nr:ABC transporter permease [Eubacteriales bacterium]